MLKRYIKSLIAMKYSFSMTLLSFLIFVFAYLTIDRKQTQYKIVVMILGIMLGILLVIYYSKRIKVSKQLKNVENIKEYDTAVMIGNCFLLKDRMLCFQGSLIHESNYHDLVSYTLLDEGKMMVELRFQNQDLIVTKLASLKQAERFAAYLKGFEKDLKVEGVKCVGDGILEHVESGEKA